MKPHALYTLQICALAAAVLAVGPTWAQVSPGAALPPITPDVTAAPNPEAAPAATPSAAPPTAPEAGALPALPGTPITPQTPAPTLPPTPTLVPSPLPPGAPTPIPLDRAISLQEAIDVARSHQPQLNISLGAAQAAAGRTVQARSAARPQFSANPQFTRSSATGGGGTRVVSGNAVSAGVTGQQLLFDFGRTRAQISQARELQQAAQQGYQQTAQDVINQVKQAYYTLLEDQRLVGVQELNLRDQQAHLTEAQTRFTVGVAPRADVYRAEAAVAQAQLTLVQAQNTSDQARIALNVAMGIDPRTPAWVEETEEATPPLPPLDQLLEAAYARRPEVRQLEADVRAAEEAVRVAEKTSAPAFFLEANYSLTGSTFPPNQHSWSYGVITTWPFYNGGLTRGRVEEAQGNLLTAQGQLSQGQQAVGQDVEQSYLNVQSAAAQVTTAAAGVVSAEESLRVATGRYAAGVGTFIEVLDAQTALLQAQTSQVTARYGLSMSRAALGHALGED